MTDEQRAEAQTIIEDHDDVLRRLTVETVNALREAAKQTGNEPVVAALDRASDVLREVPPRNRAKHREWLNDLLARLQD